MTGVFLDVPSAETPLDGTERIVSVLFSVRGSLQKGGFAPWPLFESVWQDSLSSFTLYHNATNQIKAPVGQINLDGTPFSAVGVLRHWRIVLERLDGGATETRIFIDGLFVWKNKCGADEDRAPEISGADGSSFFFRHPFEGGRPHAVFGYILIAGGRDLGTVPLSDIAAQWGFDPLRFPSFDESLFAFEPLPPVPVARTYPLDNYPFHVFPDGRAGLNPDSLPFSRSRVEKVVRICPEVNPDGFDAVVNPAAPDGKRVFATLGGAIASLKGGSGGCNGSGRIFVFAGIYVEPLAITGGDVALVGENPFTTVITGYEARTNGIARNALVHYCGQPTGSGVAPGTFTAENIAFYNRGAEWNESVGHPEKRGAALFAENIRGGVFRNCLFLGRQDTLYLKNGVIRFESCYVEGDVDFVCGGATAFFDGCHLHCLKSTEGYIAAVSPLNECGSGALPAQGAKGFTFYRCLVTSDPGQKKPLHLGRGPWINGSGLGPEEKLTTPSACAYLECSFGSPNRPFLFDENAPWVSMDGPCGNELYRVSGCGLRRKAECPE